MWSMLPRLSHPSSERRPRVRTVFAAFSLMASMFASHAIAATAVFTGPVNGNPGIVAGPSDGLGVLIGIGETIGLRVSEPFGLLGGQGFTPINNNISIFTLTGTGSALGEIAFGRYRDGNPEIFHSQRFSTRPSGQEIDLSFLSWIGCGAAGGCDYVSVSTIDGYNGAAGITLDAVTFSSVPLTQVTAPAPEPAIWLLMITGFWLIAARAKTLRLRLKLVPVSAEGASR